MCEQERLCRCCCFDTWFLRLRELVHVDLANGRKGRRKPLIGEDSSEVMRFVVILELRTPPALRQEVLVRERDDGIFEIPEIRHECVISNKVLDAK